MRSKAHLEVAELQLGRGRNNVGLVHPPEGDTVDLVRASHKEQTARELLEEDDTLPPEAAGEEDEDGAGGDGGAKLRGLGSLTAFLGLADVLSRVESGCLRGGHNTLAAVLLSSNRHLLRRCGLGCSRLLGFFEALVETTAGEDLGPGEASHAGYNFFGAGHLGGRCS